MASSAKPSSSAAKNKLLTHEQIIQGFNELRGQQRALINKISELEMERKEHDLVVEALKEIEPDRKCFRMVGGVLVERTAKEVLPAPQSNYESIGKLLESLNKQMQAKGKEINDYKEKHNLRIRGEDETSQQNKEGATKASTSVLVAPQSAS